jgi:hypothetical protein
MINQEAPTMQNAYTWMALALSFMRGQAINNWVIQQIKGLFVKCNGDVGNRIPLTYCTNNEHLWVEFSRDFRQMFTDTASEQQAYGELANCIMGNKMIDKYIVRFEHLLQKAGWDHTLQGSLFQFKRGLDHRIYLKILQKEPMPAETLEA